MSGCFLKNASALIASCSSKCLAHSGTVFMTAGSSPFSAIGGRCHMVTSPADSCSQSSTEQTVFGSSGATSLLVRTTDVRLHPFEALACCRGVSALSMIEPELRPGSRWRCPSRRRTRAPCRSSVHWVRLETPFSRVRSFSGEVSPSPDPQRSTSRIRTSRLKGIWTFATPRTGQRGEEAEQFEHRNRVADLC